jgi:hypothetical protein
MERRYFKDLKDGEQLHCKPVVTTREAIIDFVKKFDPQLFHAAHTNRLEAILNSGPVLPTTGINR